MDKNRLKQLAERADLIPGIYNYCDRWCERCPLTSRCLHWAMSQEDFSNVALQEMDHAVFWDRMRETFDATVALLQDLAVRAGFEIDLDLENDEEVIRDDRDALDHELAHLSRLYVTRVDGWFDRARSLFGPRECFEEDYLFAPTQPAAEAEWQEAVDVVQWYRSQIHVKLIRAIRSAFTEGRGLPGIPRDADGSAKVALLAMDHSILAWCTLWERFPQEEDAILSLLVLLERLRRQTEKTFPAARSFVRPGLDELEYVKMAA